MQNDKVIGYETIGKILIYIGFGLSIVGFFSFIHRRLFFDANLVIDGGTFGQFGDFIGGVVGTIVALVGVVLLYATLYAQRISFRKQQIESRFFELIKLHKENVNEISLNGKYGREVFVEIFTELEGLIKFVQAWYEKDKTYKTPSEWIFVTINIAYHLMFFGTNKNVEKYVRNKILQLVNNENDELKRNLNMMLNLSFKTNLLGNSVANEKKAKSTFHTGHQSRLSHYFRHLFQTVTYINNLPPNILTYSEKYEYVKTLRAQLSIHEQAIFFVNSISDLGKVWEREISIFDENKKLITKYNFIKNIPEGFITFVNFKEYYPLIQYEFDNIIADRRKLEMIYNNLEKVRKIPEEYNSKNEFY